MSAQSDTLSWWEWMVLFVSTFLIYQHYKRKKGPQMTAGQKLGYGVVSFFGGCGAVIVLSVSVYFIRAFIAIVFGTR